MSRLVRAVARPLLASIFVTGGLDVLRNPRPRAEIAGPTLDRIRQVFPVLPADDTTLVQANAAVQVGAGALFALGRFRRLSALALAASLLPTTVAGHAFWTKDDPAQRAQQRVQLTKNAAILGGLLLAMAESDAQRGPSRCSRRAARAAERQLADG